MTFDLTNPIFNDEAAAREHLENNRWPDGPWCPRCGEAESITLLKGKSHRPGLYKCNSCRKPFTVTVGTLFERSKVPLHKWVLATHLLCSSKKGMSSHQLHRMLGVTYKTAWFMTHRIREAMRDDNPEPMGGSGKIINADETYFGSTTRRNSAGKRGPANKRVVMALVSEGQARSFHVDGADAYTARRLLATNARRESELHTDESRIYVRVGTEFAAHKTVNHSAKVYVSKEGVTTNPIENFFSIFKRGMRGIYQHCGEKHLHRYLAEFDFRYNARQITDAERANKALQGIWGKRLTYRRIGQQAANA